MADSNDAAGVDDPFLPPLEAVGESAPAPVKSGTSRRRVVVAEDEALIRLDLVEMLTEAGYDVVGEAGDGESAMRLAEE